MCHPAGSTISPEHAAAYLPETQLAHLPGGGKPRYLVHVDPIYGTVLGIQTPRAEAMSVIQRTKRRFEGITPLPR